ncbi:hypothetical protein VNO77_23311 [Canavalia gladiata]|uniref:Uncharacterized protein n=1 Tax=Canavalia gladiata TaxID=3824 RepID=A0AAN9QBL0_CANGL
MLLEVALGFILEIDCSKVLIKFKGSVDGKTNNMHLGRDLFSGQISYSLSTTSTIAKSLLRYLCFLVFDLFDEDACLWIGYAQALAITAALKIGLATITIGNSLA